MRPSDLSNVRPLARIMWHALRGLYCWSISLFDEGLTAFEEGRQVSESTGVHVWDFVLFLSGILSSLATGDTGKGRELLQTVASRMDRSHEMHMAHWHYHAAWHALLDRDFLRSLEHAQAAMDIAVRLNDPFTYGTMHRSLAQALYACGRRGEALEVIEEGVRLAREQRAMLMLFRHIIVRAYFDMDRGEHGRAAETLREAFAISKERGYLNFSWWRKDLMARVCVKALEEGIEVEWVPKMIRRRDLMPEQPLNVESWPWPLKLRTLGRFEIVKGESPSSFRARSSRSRSPCSRS